MDCKIQMASWGALVCANTFTTFDSKREGPKTTMLAIVYDVNNNCDYHTYNDDGIKSTRPNAT